jgi:hypothetical protein
MATYKRLGVILADPSSSSLAGAGILTKKIGINAQQHA